MLDDEHRVLLIGECDGAAIGQVRFDRVEPARWEISATVAPEVRGRGYGRALIAAGVAWLWRNDPATRCVDAWIREENTRSIAVFVACGFSPVGLPDSGMAHLRLRRKIGDADRDAERAEAVDQRRALSR